MTVPARHAPTLLAALLAATPALAQPRPEAPPEVDREREEARERFRRGVARADAREWPEAVAEFEAARQLSPTLPLLYNLAVALQAVGRLVEARTTLREFRALAWTELSPARREEVEGRLRAIEAELGELRFEVSPASAAVLLDGRLLPPGVTSWPVEPGAHRVTVEADGYERDQRGVTVASASRVAVRVALARRRGFGTLAVRAARPGVAVTVDGEALPRGERSLEVLPGRHRVRATEPGRLVETRDVEVRVGERLEVAVDPRRNLIESPAFWGVAGPLLAVAVAGVVLLMQP